MRAPSSVPPPSVPDQSPPAAADDPVTPIAPQLAAVERVIRDCTRVPEVPMLEEVLQAVLIGPAKRLRPALALHAAQIVDGRPDDVAKLAAATEVLHSATLVHDDIVDSSAERRGRPAVHVTWSQKIAVLAGDYLFAAAADLVAQLDRPAIVRLFAATIHDMSVSEFVIPTYDGNVDIARRQYLEKIGHKTASLFALACDATAALADAPASEREALRDLGWSLGMAFQITDDILDISGSVSETGKPVGTDLRAGLVTLPSILYLRDEPSGGGPVEAVLAGRTTDDDAVARALDAIKASGAVEEAAGVAGSYAARAYAALDRVRPAPSRASFAAFIRQATERRR